MTTKQTIPIMIALVAIMIIVISPMALATEEDHEADQEARQNMTLEERHAEIQQIRDAMIERFADMTPEEKNAEIQKIRDALKEYRYAMKERFADMTPEEKNAEIQKIREERNAVRESRQNMTEEERQERQAYFDVMSKLKENHGSIKEQIALGVDIQDIVCAQDRELMIRVSNGSPLCISSTGAILLIDKGFAAYPDES